MATKAPTKPYKILIKFPTRNRPQKFIECIKEMYINMGDKFNTKVIVTADIDDPSMYNADLLNAIRPFVDNYGMEIHYGKSDSKIHAVNRDIEKYEDWDILLIMSDDMKCVQSAFDYQIREMYSQFFPDMDGIIHYNDGYTRDRIITLALMGRKYYERFGYVYHPDYISLWADNEMYDVAKILTRIVYVEQPIFTHQHFSNVGGFMDEQLRFTESFSGVDNETYEKRKKAKFPVKSV